MDIAQLILLIPVLLFSLSIHEYSHGKMADLLGDPTPEMTGRLTLNPLAHLDLMGTLVLLFTQRFGWAKPVRVDPRYFDDPKQGMMYVGLAGPASNILMAILLAGLFNSLAFVLPPVVLIFLQLGVGINLGLAIFNLLPVPPLDGSKILAGFLPRKYDSIIYQLEAYGPFVLLFLVFTGVLGNIIGPIWFFFYRLLL
ncbi:site-2 protease family protein [Fuchsiella alkaliacetigena]|uniref:site-2 protease family protein n=1 Tax=Fuchsiella alkaliacetigena TaxID=957042 RepID=UPI00200B49D0|nr:site-2 protease family protein [Fuchsiella alkaliacetigena]MCK8825721.1 site-2 protease family protein [Fuchsiella alkaliacetigena]